MSDSPEVEPEPQPKPYVGAYRLARKTWLYMLTDDDACRDICDREAHLRDKMSAEYPAIPEADRAWLGESAYDAVLDDFRR